MAAQTELVLSTVVKGTETARKALNDALIRRNIRADVLTGKYPGFFRVKREIKGNPKVSIIIPTKNKFKVLKKWRQRLRLGEGVRPE